MEYEKKDWNWMKKQAYGWYRSMFWSGANSEEYVMSVWAHEAAKSGATKDEFVETMLSLPPRLSRAKWAPRLSACYDLAAGGIKCELCDLTVRQCEEKVRNNTWVFECVALDEDQDICAKPAAGVTDTGWPLCEERMREHGEEGGVEVMAWGNL
jgi:hypothetical protein